MSASSVSVQRLILRYKVPVSRRCHSIGFGHVDSPGVSSKNPVDPSGFAIRYRTGIPTGPDNARRPMIHGLRCDGAPARLAIASVSMSRISSPERIPACDAGVPAGTSAIIRCPSMTCAVYGNAATPVLACTFMCPSHSWATQRCKPASASGFSTAGRKRSLRSFQSIPVRSNDGQVVAISWCTTPIDSLGPLVAVHVSSDRLVRRIVRSKLNADSHALSEGPRTRSTDVPSRTRRGSGSDSSISISSVRPPVGAVSAITISPPSSTSISACSNMNSDCKPSDLSQSGITIEIGPESNNGCIAPS